MDPEVIPPWCIHYPYFFFQNTPWIFCYFLLETPKFSFLYIYDRHRNHHPTILKPVHDIVTNSKHHPYFFFQFYCYFFIWENMYFLIWKCDLNPENSAWPLSPTVTSIPVFFPLFFLLFSLPFLFEKASISLFVSEPWTTQNIALGR